MRPGGKSKARAALKCVSPAKMIQPIVPITPNHNIFESRPMAVMLPVKQQHRKETNNYCNRCSGSHDPV